MVKQIFFVVGAFCVLVMAKLSYLGIAVLMGIESACIPLPSELIMPYAGAMTIPEVNAALAEQYHVSLPQFSLLFAAIAGALGCNLGSEVAYWVGATGGRKGIEKYGKYVLLSQHELRIVDRWFQKRGDIIVFLARLLPVVRTFIAFPAGVARMPRLKFHVYTFVGSLPWCYALGYVGQRLGLELTKDESPLKHFMHRFDAVIGVIILVAAAFFIYTRVKALRSYRDKSGNKPSDKADEVNAAD